MIVRKWCAVADHERGYIAHFHLRVVPALVSIRGFEGALLLGAAPRRTKSRC